MILNRKKRRQALLRITACQIIALAEIDNVESFEKITDNLAVLAFYVGGVNGMVKVVGELEHYMQKDKGDANG